MSNYVDYNDSKSQVKTFGDSQVYRYVLRRIARIIRMARWPKWPFLWKSLLVQSWCARKLGCVGCLVWLRALAHTLIAQLYLAAANG